MTYVLVITLLDFTKIKYNGLDINEVSEVIKKQIAINQNIKKIDVYKEVK